MVDGTVGTDVIIESKLFRPHSSEALRRPHLVQRLDALVSSTPVVVVWAPGGYGKSTLVSQWSISSAEPVVWVSVDEYDRQPAALLSYLVVAIRRLYPEFGEATRLLLGSPQEVDVQPLTDALLSDLEDLPGPAILVLDDYDILAGSPAEQMIQRLAQYLPASLRLVLICRSRPGPTLMRLQMRGQLAELRAEDLRLTRVEAADLLSALAGRPIDQETVTLVDGLTEGWVTAVSLAGISLRRRTDMDMNRLLSGEDHSRLMEYLMADVARQIPAEMVSFLLRTALLDELSPELCSAVIAVDDDGQLFEPPQARQLLTAIRHANLFLIPLDDRGEWYRYHHLFGQLLRREGLTRLSDAERETIHRRAGEWYETRGRIRKAIHHALLANDPAEAARIAEAHYHDALNREEWGRLVVWLEMLPDSVMERPGIVMMRAWVEHFGWRTQSAAALAEEVKRLLAADDRIAPAEAARLRAEADVLLAQMAQFVGDERAAEWAASAVDVLPPTLVFARSMGELYLGLGRQLQGRQGEGAVYLERAIAESAAGSLTRTFRLFIGLFGVHFYSGDYNSMGSSARMFYDLAVRTNNTLSIGWATWMLGQVAYERNDLATAEARFREVVQMRLSTHAKAVTEGFQSLVITLLNQGRLDEAEDMLARYRAHIAETKALLFLPLLESLQNRLRLARWLADPGRSTDDLVIRVPEALPLKLGFVELPRVTAARVLLAKGDETSLYQALDILLETRAEAVRTNELRLLVMLNALLAAVRWHMGQEEAALDDLRAALAQGEPQGYVRSVVDIGTPLAPVLARLCEQGEFVAYCDRLRAALNDPTVVGGAALEILLTNREMEVLERLALRQSNKEIAAELYLSPLTVKRHTQSLFRKLGATNRREAVVLARQKGLSFEAPGPVPR